MKKLLSLSLFLSLTFLSCSTDEDIEMEASQSDTSAIKLKKNWSPQNTANPHDQAGILYHQILEQYNATIPTNTTPSQIIFDIESIANSFSEFNSMKNNSYSSIGYNNISWILSTEESYHTAISNNTNLSATAKDQLETMTSTLKQMIDAQATSKNIHDYIISFEATISSSLFLTATEKKTILTSSSIARHANYQRKKGRRWDIHHGMTGSIYGDNENMAKAVTTAASISAIGNTINE